MVTNIRIESELNEILKNCPNGVSYSKYIYNRIKNTEIDRLNEIAKIKEIKLENSDDQYEVAEMLLYLIDEEGYEILSEYQLNRQTDDTQTVLIRKDGLKLNCWILGNRTGVCDGNQGFDNNIEMYDDEYNVIP